MSTIERLKCQVCGTIQQPEHLRCIKCKSLDLQNYQCKPSGTVITYTTCHVLPEPISYYEKITFAIIELECGGRILGQIHSSEGVKIGARVRGKLGVVSKQEGEEEICLRAYCDGNSGQRLIIRNHMRLCQPA